MAIAYARVQTHTRSKGHSAIAAAAYRSGTRLVDERTGIVHDYTRRKGILHTEIFTPANTPTWAQDREKLWNKVEFSEKKVNSVVARDQPMALPHELGLDQWKIITRDFATYLVGRHGVAVDVAIHSPDPQSDQRNYHAHFLLSTRQLGEEGFTKKTRELDDRKQGGQILKEWREQWARIVNRELERAGLDVRIDMRSYAEQGIDREGQKHLGPEWTEFERKTGEKSYRAQFNEAVKARNAVKELEAQAKVIDIAIAREQRRLAQDAQRHAADEQHRPQSTPRQAANDNTPAVERARDVLRPAFTASAAPDIASEKANDMAETWDRDAYNQQWQEKIDQAGIDHAEGKTIGQQWDKHAVQPAAEIEKRRQAEAEKRGKIDEWANERRALIQSRQMDERIALERRHSRAANIEEDRLKKTYGERREVREHRIHQIEQRQEKGGFWYNVVGFRRAQRERDELEGLRLTVADSRAREEGVRTTYQNEQKREMENLLQGHARENAVSERWIEQAFETGRIPENTRGREPEHGREAPQHDLGRTAGGGGDGGMGRLH